MTTSKKQESEFSEFGVAYNSLSIQRLFQKYDEIGFIYESKKKLLAPHFNLISQNWQSLLKSKEELLWVFTNDQLEEDGFASVSAWRHNLHGVLAQHLVSEGNPFLSLKVMLAAQVKAQSDPNVHSSQNWFRPNNRYAKRVFSSMVEKLGPQKSSLRLFENLKMPLKVISEKSNSLYSAKTVSCKDRELIHFVKTEYGNVFVKAEELDKDDIQQKELTLLFSPYGLFRSRKVIKIVCSKTGKIVACAIANRAPLGLNFSFLENRCYYIVDKNLDIKNRHQILELINCQIASYYSNIEIGSIPIVTDQLTSNCLQNLGAEYLRTYMQSIWLREGFRQWFDHIFSFLKRIENRKVKVA